jgi:hypothetical protein
MAGNGTSSEWTCARCTVTASWATPGEQHDLPSGWIQQDGLNYCLACARELAGEAGEASAPDDATEAGRKQASTAARIEFELNRDPNRADTKIARASHSSVSAVRVARERLGVYPTGPS